MYTLYTDYVRSLLVTQRTWTSMDFGTLWGPGIILCGYGGWLYSLLPKQTSDLKLHCPYRDPLRREDTKLRWWIAIWGLDVDLGSVRSQQRAWSTLLTLLTETKWSFWSWERGCVAWESCRGSGLIVVWWSPGKPGSLSPALSLVLYESRVQMKGGSDLSRRSKYQLCQTFTEWLQCAELCSWLVTTTLNAKKPAGAGGSEQRRVLHLCWVENRFGRGQGQNLGGWPGGDYGDTLVSHGGGLGRVLVCDSVTWLILNVHKVSLPISGRKYSETQR
jgi:hypothetical protein